MEAALSHFVRTNTIHLHYLEHPGGAPPVVLLPGLTANAHAFDGLIQAGLSPRHRVLALDLRGRGLSEQPPTGYRMADHAADVLGVLDSLQLKQVVLGGHSFGGLLALFLGAHYPERFTHLIVLDAAISVATQRTREQIQPAIARLQQTYPDWKTFLTTVRTAPYWDGWWHPLVEAYYQADVRMNADGSVQPRSRPATISAAMDGVLAEDWPSIVSAVQQPTLLCNATGAYGPPGTPPILTEMDARATADLLSNGHYRHVPGNHMTMLYGAGAQQIGTAIVEVLA